MNKRYKRILVPLDGSELAELALVDALSLAELSEADVTLLRIIPPMDEVIIAGEHTIVLDEQRELKQEQAEEYLSSVCQRKECRNLNMQTVIEFGPVGETIIDYAREHPIDLIVMATHGRSGLSRWFMGSVADKVIHGANQPVLLVRAYSNDE